MIYFFSIVLKEATNTDEMYKMLKKINNEISELKSDRRKSCHK